MNKRAYLIFFTLSCAQPSLYASYWQTKREEWQRKNTQSTKQSTPVQTPKSSKTLKTIIQQSTIQSMFSSDSAYHNLLKIRLLEVLPDGSLEWSPTESLETIDMSPLENAIITEQKRIAHEKMSWYQKTALAEWIRNHPNSTELIKIVVYASIGGYVTYYARDILTYCGIPLPETITPAPTRMTTGTQSETATPMSAPSMTDRSCQTDPSDDGFVHVGHD